MNTKVLVGLGNPGHRFSGTRHNAGFLLVDRLIDLLAAQPVSGDGNGLLWSAVHGETRLFLMKPLTYMNLSGAALASFLNRNPLSLAQVLIAYDDVALPVGHLRLRPSGSAGGQKGMAHIIETLQSKDVPRLRIGVGTAAREALPLRDFVLEPFADEELPAVRDALSRAAQAVLSWLDADIQTVMGRFNVKPAPCPEDNHEPAV